MLDKVEYSHVRERWEAIVRQTSCIERLKILKGAHDDERAHRDERSASLEERASRRPTCKTAKFVCTRVAVSAEGDGDARHVMEAKARRCSGLLRLCREKLPTRWLYRAGCKHDATMEDS